MDNTQQNVQYVKKDNDSKKIFTMLVLIFTLMICTTGATYAFFAISATNNTATGTAATVGLDLKVSRVTPTDTKWNQTTGTVTTKVMVPQLDAGLSTAMNSTNSCVDGNGNVVCQVYKIEIENTSTSAVRLRGAVYFTFSSGTFNNLYWRQTTNANTVGSNTIFKYSTAATTNSTAANTANSTLVADKLLQPATSTSPNGSGGDYAIYYVVVWIREINENQGNEAASNKKDQGTWLMNVSFEDKVNPGKGVTSTITS